MKNHFLVKGELRSLDGCATQVARVEQKPWSYRRKLLICALLYASAGLRVLPVGRAKQPACRGGVKAASCDANVIRQMLTGEARGIAVACGARGEAQFFGLDLDAPKVPAQGGFDWLRGLPASRAADLAEGIRVATPGGGAHLWLTAPPGVAIANRAGAVAPGVDTRGEGGYLVAPPSWDARGHYRFTSTSRAREAPSWLLALPAVTKTLIAQQDVLRLGQNAPILSRAMTMREQACIEAMAATSAGQRHDRLLRSSAAMAARGSDDSALVRLTMSISRRTRMSLPT